MTRLVALKHHPELEHIICIFVYENNAQEIKVQMYLKTKSSLELMTSRGNIEIKLLYTFQLSYFIPRTCWFKHYATTTTININT